jgi:hypothetical protein
MYTHVDIDKFSFATNMLSKQGQYLVEKTGYTSINEVPQIITMGQKKPLTYFLLKLDKNQ